MEIKSNSYYEMLILSLRQHAKRTKHVGASTDVSAKDTTAQQCCGCQNMCQYLRRHYQMPTSDSRLY